MTERFISPCPPPTPRQAEILTILIEECAEVQQRATKMLRFGVEEIQPTHPLSNKQRLSMEVGDLLTMIDVARRAGLLSSEDIEMGRWIKRQKLKEFMQHRGKR